MRVLVKSSLLLFMVGGCVFASPNARQTSPSYTSSSREFVTDEDGECSQWGGDSEYEQCLDEQRHAEQMASEAATRKTVVWAATEQAGAAREATGSAMIGDGRHTGDGWWCFSGSYEGKQPFGRCFRSMNYCATRLVARVDDGMQATAPQCVEQDAATCFTTANQETGDVRHYCFPAASMCSPHERAAVADPQQDAQACRLYQ